MTRTEDSAIMTVAEMKALRNNVGSEEFEHRIGLHCKEMFEGVVVDDFSVKKDVIVYKCANHNDDYDYCITVSFDGSAMFGQRVENIFKGARFGDKFVTENGDVVIYG